MSNKSGYCISNFSSTLAGRRKLGEWLPGVFLQSTSGTCCIRPLTPGPLPLKLAPDPLPPAIALYSTGCLDSKCCFKLLVLLGRQHSLATGSIEHASGQHECHLSPVRTQSVSKMDFANSLELTHVAFHLGVRPQARIGSDSRQQL